MATRALAILVTLRMAPARRRSTALAVTTLILARSTTFARVACVLALQRTAATTTNALLTRAIPPVGRV